MVKDNETDEQIIKRILQDTQETNTIEHLQDAYNTQTTVTDTLLENNTSVILQDGSIYDSFFDNSNDDIANMDLSQIEANETTEKTNLTSMIDLLKVMQSQTNLADADDAIIHSIALTTNRSIQSKEIHEGKKSMYISKQQIWLMQNQNEYFNNNYYKILSRVMNMNNKTITRVDPKKLQKIKQDILHEFISIPIHKTHHLQHIHHLSKMNGIFLFNESITQAGRVRILNDFRNEQLFSEVVHDIYSSKKFESYLKMDQAKMMISKNTKTRVIHENDVTEKTLFRNFVHSTEIGTRCDLRIQLSKNASKSNETPFQVLKNTLQEVITKLQEIDRSIVFLPWFTSNDLDPLLFNTIPDKLWEVNRYFPRVKPGIAGVTYGEFRFTHKKPIEEILQDISPWLYDRKSAIYYHSLQCKLTSNIGWLVWSVRNIDTEVLQQELFRLYNIKLQLRYQNVALSKGSKEGNEIVRALNIIVNKDEADRIASILQIVYGFKATKFPLGISMQYLPHINKINIKKEPSIVKWRQRHSIFTQIVQDPQVPMMARTWEILNLDDVLIDNTTLRKILMDIRSTIDEKEYLFISVDFSYFRNTEVLFTFLPKHEQEARAFVANLIPFIRYKYGAINLDDIFIAEALQRNDNSVWNADAQEIVSAADLYLEQSMEDTMQFNMLEVLGIDESGFHGTILENNPERDKVQRLFTGEDDTTVGSIFTKKPSNDDTPTTNTISTSTNTIKSHGTTLTIDEVDAKITNLSEDMKTLHTMMTTLLQRQEGNFLSSSASLRTPKVTGEQQNSSCETP